ncbi:peptide/nickel transport system ATP-binding protein [Halorubrum aquaticum]|uniref:Peptide/nickel transport system ATP-binding protein n=1 Tax=Halorubrum aquaticum TaxID=387340 RepID=A0A1I3CC71_9EURY|nr:ABC transporter ATP-binding protein [Halorubrum aquaticum]SFH72067.1 peptide/nickel transport system ATP-binding protein [Halorubrum aquaticum]
MTALLEVEDLTVRFYTEEGVVTAVDGLSYRIEAGETFGVVGESGAGKSVAALSVLGLIDDPGRIERGEVRFKGEDLRSMTDAELRSVRGDEIAMVFQDARAALNPVYTVGEQIAETIEHHMGYDPAAARDRAVRLLDRVGIPEAGTRYSDYPHEFSGGMCQRATVAMALSCEPDLIVADEPTTALDVTVEARVLDLLADLADEFDVAVQLITHDLGVIAGTCDRAMVMYAGEAVERAPIEELYYDPKHPYTAGLMSAIPHVGDDRDRLQTIPGTMPDLIDVPSGCRFHPRCPFAEEACTRTDPALVDPENGEAATLETERAAACLEYTEGLTGGLDYSVEVDGETNERAEDDDGGEDDDGREDEGEEGGSDE